jgi:hypothetical protein
MQSPLCTCFDCKNISLVVENRGGFKDVMTNSRGFISNPWSKSSSCVWTFMLSNVMCMWLLGRKGKGAHLYGSFKGKSCLKEFILGEYLNVGIFVLFLSSILLIFINSVSCWILWVTITSRWRRQLCLLFNIHLVCYVLYGFIRAHCDCPISHNWKLGSSRMGHYSIHNKITYEWIIVFMNEGSKCSNLWAPNNVRFSW